MARSSRGETAGRGRLAYALAVGLSGAALVHVAAVLLAPRWESAQAWTRLADTLPELVPTRAEAAAVAAPGGGSDPFFLVSLCRFDLRQGPVRVAARGGRALFWTAALLLPDGRVAASLSGSGSSDAPPDFLVVPAGGHPAASDRSILMEAEGTEGIVALRVFAPDESWRPLAEDLLSRLECRREG